MFFCFFFSFLCAGHGCRRRIARLRTHPPNPHPRARRVRQLQPHYRHACLLLTAKDYARQWDLFDAFFSQHSADSAAGTTSGVGDGDASGWGAYVLQASRAGGV